MCDTALRELDSAVTKYSGPNEAAAFHSLMQRVGAKLRGVALWSLLHGHLNVDNGTDAITDPAIAELAARMALLPVQD